MPTLLNLPTMDESGYKGFEVGIWYGMWVPKGTPKPVVDKLVKSLQAGLADPKFQERMKQAGGHGADRRRQPPGPGGRVKQQVPQWAELFEESRRRTAQANQAPAHRKACVFLPGRPDARRCQSAGLRRHAQSVETARYRRLVAERLGNAGGGIYQGLYPIVLQAFWPGPRMDKPFATSLPVSSKMPAAMQRTPSSSSSLSRA